MPKVDLIIVGQGLAGSVLAWRAVERALSVFVVDRGGTDDRGGLSASRVAAGLMTPITGRRLTLSPNWTPLRKTAEKLYRDAEEQIGRNLFHARPSARLFASDDEREWFEKRCQAADYAEQVGPLEAAELPAGIQADAGGFWMPQAARLDVPAFVDATREWLVARGAYAEGNLDPATDIEPLQAGVRIPSLAVEAERVVYCQGYSPGRLPSGLRGEVVPARGELLRVAAPGLGLTSVVHGGVWIAPAFEAVDEYLVGATTHWEEGGATPTEAAREQLLDGLRRIYAGEVRVLEQQVAVRPATSDREPIAGVSREHTRVAWLNGLGGKGVLTAPWHAEKLCHTMFGS